MALDLTNAFARVPSAFDSALAGVNRGREEVQLRAAQEQAAQRQQEVQAALDGLRANPNPTGRDFANVMLQIPELQEQLKAPMDLLEKDAMEQNRSQALQVYSAMIAGQADIAKGIIERDIEAAENSGDEEGAAAGKAMLQLIDMDPEAAKTSMGLHLAASFGDEFDNVLKTLQERQGAPKREIETDALGRKRFVDSGELIFPEIKTPEAPTPREEFDIQERRQDLAESEAERLAGKMSAASEAALIQAQDAAQDSDVAVSELLSVASEFDQLDQDTAAGFAGKAREALRGFLGAEDDITRLRKRYNQIKNNQVMQNLPPGVASDKDIEIAMSGFLKDTANPQTAASFLRGLAKMEKINGEFQAFKADWLSREGNPRGMFKAWKDQFDEAQQEGPDFTKVPSDIEPELWNVMSDEEKEQWLNL